MISGIRQKAIVGNGGRISIPSSDLPKGASVEVIVLIEPIPQEATEYLLSNKANSKHLYQALDDLEKRESYNYINESDL